VGEDVTFDARTHHRRSIRLAGYDYTLAGGYFVTLVVKEREDLFGVVVEGEMVLNPFGKVVREMWLGIQKHYPHVRLDEFCVMPNHFHGILILTDDGRGGSVQANSLAHQDDSMSANNGQAMSQTRPIKRHGLPEIIRAFKSFSARKINHMRGTPGTPVWQRNYYEHIIRNERELFAIQRYIRDNPQKWGLDSENKSSETPISA
jgi:REP element-mobilizing transposase RayT